MSDNRPTLLTLFRVKPGQTIDRTFLEGKVKEFDGGDDVFDRQCLQAILFQGARKTELSVTADAELLLEEWKTIWTDFLACERSQDLIPPGPYYLDERGLHQLYRVHDDYNKAFVVAAVPSQDRPQ